MLKNYVVIALRTLGRQKGYAFLNLFGLAVGLACFLMIAAYVQFELSFDRFHAKADRIYRVVQQQPGNMFMGSDVFAVTPAPLAETLVEVYPEVVQATKVSGQRALLSVDERRFYEYGIRADAAFFDVFDFPLLRGDAATALAEPNRVVLTEPLARKLFGDDDPVGRTVLLQNDETYTVTGLAPAPPGNSHLTFDYVTSIVSDESYVENLGEWSNSGYFTYFVLAEGGSPARLQAKLPDLVDRHLADNWSRPSLPVYRLQALTDIHLSGASAFELSSTNSDVRYVYLFAAVALVILLLACINYTNLAVAQSLRRAREVGVRKVLGAHRRQLAGQYLAESVLMALLALVLALGLTYLLLPVFGDLVGRPLRLDVAATPWLVPMLVALVAGAGLLAGSYPALFMSSLQPVAVFKGKGVPRGGRLRLQRALIVGQYAASIVLVIGSLVTYQQLRYVQHKEMGYDREHVVTMPLRDRSLTERFPVLKERLLGHPSVAAVTSSGHLPTSVSSSTRVQEWEGKEGDDPVPIYQTGVGYDFFEVFQIPLVEGRAFSPDFPSDSAGAYILNETAVRRLGWETAVGKAFKDGVVVGVVKDFHLHSLHRPIEPLMLSYEAEWMNHLSVRIRPGDLEGTIAHLQETMQAFTAFPFEYDFLDEAFNRLYETELRLGRTLRAFMLLALLIASLGLFGLAAFAAAQRTKEVGIRKVLGATVPGLVLLLSKDFVRLVAVAFVVAVPVAYLLMDRWLDAFAYRVDLSWQLFLITGLASLSVAFLTVSYQAVRAAMSDPAKSLRYE